MTNVKGQSEFRTAGCPRRNTAEVDLNFLRPTGKISDVLCFDGKSHFGLSITKSHLRYLVLYRTLSSLSKIQNGIRNQNAATRTNTDNRLRPNEFRHRNQIREIPTRDVGCDDDFKDFLEYLTDVYGGGLQLIFQNYRI